MKCHRCGEEAEGYAYIGANRLCHSETRRCYEDESYEEAFRLPSGSVLAIRELLRLNPPLPSDSEDPQ